MSTDVTISQLSTQYIQVPVSATIGGVPYNPSGDVVQLAFQTGQSQPSGDWHTGSWVVTAQGGYLAQCLVGPSNGGVVLAPGLYQIWVMITDSPEIPVIAAGSLTVY
jgi:hypothetical protein